MLTTLIKTPLGRAFHDFLRTKFGRDYVDKPFVRFCGLSLLMEVHCRLFDVPKLPILMLYAKGRKSGQERSSVLPYHLVDGIYYLVGSRGGQEKNPQWVENMRANPKGRIVVNRRKFLVTCRILADDEPLRQKIWEISSKVQPTNERYQSYTTRLFPILALTPIE